MQKVDVMMTTSCCCIFIEKSTLIDYGSNGKKVKKGDVIWFSCTFQ